MEMTFMVLSQVARDRGWKISLGASPKSLQNQQGNSGALEEKDFSWDKSPYSICCGLEASITVQLGTDKHITQKFYVPSKLIPVYILE
jgi:hypothetical protein